MMRRILGVLGLIMMIGVAAAIPVNRAEAQTEITASEAVILNQALGVLAATLRLMNERVQSQNIPPEKVQELTATLGKISFSLLTLSRSAGESALAVVKPEPSPIAKAPSATAPAVAVKKEAPPNAPPVTTVTIKDDKETAAVAVAGQEEAAGELTAGANLADTATTGRGWKSVGRIVWIVVVVGLVAWFGYNQFWKKRLALKSSGLPAPTETP